MTNLDRLADATLPENPFARVDQPFGAFLDPEGWMRLQEGGARNLAQGRCRSRPVADLSVAFAQNLSPCWWWGRQYARRDGDGAGWTSEIVGELKVAYAHLKADEAAKDWGRPLKAWHLYRHLFGMGICLGTCDALVCPH